MSREFLSDEEAEEAFQWLQANVEACAVAGAQKAYLEEYRKVLKARIMQEHDGIGVSAQEREAYADARYAELVEGYKIAVENALRLQYTRDNKMTLIDAWRTASKNRRGGEV